MDALFFGPSVYSGPALVQGGEFMCMPVCVFFVSCVVWMGVHSIFVSVPRVQATMRSLGVTGFEDPHT